MYPLTAGVFSPCLPRSKDTGRGNSGGVGRWEEIESVKHLLRGKERPKASFVVVE